MVLTYFDNVFRRKRLLLVTLISFVLYYPSFSNFFFSDDWFHLRITQIHSIREFINFFSFSQTPQFAGSYRPLSTQVFFFIFQSLFGLNPIPYHLFVWGIFVVGLWLLYKVSLEILNSRKAAIIAVLIYGASVTNFTRLYFLSAFQEILMVAFVLGSVLTYLRATSKPNGFRHYIGVLVFFILALMSKETAIVLPGILILVDWRRRRLDLKRLLPVVLMGLIYGYLRFVSLGSIAGQSYVWDFSLKKLGNSLMWYGFWSLGVPEFLVDYVGSGLRVLPRFFVNFSGWAYLIIFLWISVSLSFMALLARWIRTDWQAFVLGMGIFVGGLVPVVFLPWHKFTLELGLSMVGIAIVLGQFLKKKSLAGYIFVAVYILTNVTTNVFYLSHHYSVNRANLSYKVYQYFEKHYPTLPRNSYFEFINDTSDFGPQWGSSKQIAQATSGSNMFKVLYDDPEYEVYFEDYSGKRPDNENKIEVSTRMFTE